MLEVEKTCTNGQKMCHVPLQLMYKCMIKLWNEKHVKMSIIKQCKKI